MVVLINLCFLSVFSPVISMFSFYLGIGSVFNYIVSALSVVACDMIWLVAEHVVTSL